MLARVVTVPGLELRLAPRRDIDVAEDLVGLRPKEAAHPLDLLERQARRILAVGLPLRVDQLAEALDAERLDEDLDARLVEVVAAPLAVVDPQDGIQISQQLLARQELAEHLADHRCAP